MVNFHYVKGSNFCSINTNYVLIGPISPLPSPVLRTDPESISYLYDTKEDGTNFKFDLKLYVYTILNFLLLNFELYSKGKPKIDVIA